MKYVNVHLLIKVIDFTIQLKGKFSSSLLNTLLCYMKIYAESICSHTEALHSHIEITSYKKRKP